MNKVTITDLNFKNRRVLVRVDFNVPLDGNQNITDDRRIRAVLPTLKKLSDDGARVIICSHLGRPKGKYAPKMSLRPVAKRLSELLEREVLFAEDCIGPEASNLIDKMGNGDSVMLENLRFHPEEEENDAEFARKLAALADIFVNDAFGTAHRAHASTVGVTRHYQQSVAGFLMEKELRYLGKTLADPARPFAAILGGAKISGKIDVINSLIGKVDILIIGGGMTFTFAKAMGYSIGDSLLEADKIELAKELIAKIKNSTTKLFFPCDAVVAAEISNEAESKVVDIDKIPDGMKGLDIGPSSVQLFSHALVEAKTILWNGPMGVFEIDQFATGTLDLARILGDMTSQGSITIVGGGDSAAAISKAGLDDKFSHISTGGGAALEFLEGKKLPGVEALTDATHPEKAPHA